MSANRQHQHSTTKSCSGWLQSVNRPLAIVILCSLCYYNALYCEFCFDDISAIKENKDLRPMTPIVQLFFNDFWGQPIVKEYSHKSYRPICVLTFRFNYWLHQLRPFGYHLTNVVLHILVSLCYFRFCQLIMPLRVSFLAAILFSVHPIHTEAVTSVVGRAETLCSLFYLISLLAYSSATKRRSVTNWPIVIVSMFLIGLATFSKEQGITAVAVCALFELVLNQKLHQSQYKTLLSVVRYGRNSKASCPKWIKEMAIRIGALLLSAFLIVALRLGVMQSQLPVFTRFDNPAAYSESPVRQLTHNYLFALNAWLLLNPMDLCCDWTMGTIALVESMFDVRNGVTVLFYLTILALAWKAISSLDSYQFTVIVTSLSLTIIPFLPASNLFFSVGFVVAERVLYIPSFGFCMLIAYGVSVLYETSFTNSFIRDKTKKMCLVAALIVIVLSQSLRTILRNQDWKTEYSIFTSGIRINKRNAKLFNNVGHVLETQKQYSEALTFFLKAIEIQPDDLGAFMNVGRVYTNLKQLELAEQYFKKAKDLLPQAQSGHKGGYYARIAPYHLNVFINLGNLISKNSSRLNEAEQLYREATQMRSDYVEAYINQGEILLRMNRTADAERAYKTALYYDHTNSDIYYNLGVVSIELGQLYQAIFYFDKAIQINPKHQQALLNYAIVVQDADRLELYDLAESRLKQLLRLGISNERVYFNLAMIAMNGKRYAEAERWFQNAIQIREDFPSATFNIALLLSETNRPLEAVPYLKRLIHLYPQHIKGLILLGDILINYSKDLDGAKDCYQRILKLDSRNIQAKHNLCVVYVEQRFLQQAEQCLDEAAQIAPYESYINRHLKVVRLRILKLKQTNGNKNNTSGA